MSCMICPLHSAQGNLVEDFLHFSHPLLSHRTPVPLPRSLWCLTTKWIFSKYWIGWDKNANFRDSWLNRLPTFGSPVQNEDVGVLLKNDLELQDGNSRTVNQVQSPSGRGFLCNCTDRPHTQEAGPAGTRGMQTPGSVGGGGNTSEVI